LFLEADREFDRQASKHDVGFALASIQE